MRSSRFPPDQNGDNRPSRSSFAGPSTPSDNFTRPFRKHKTLLSIPYTTAASEFLYGTSSVRAALRSGRRKLYKLYIYSGDHRSRVAEDDALRREARQVGVEVVTMREEDELRVMDKMCQGRPHNGYILETSPLPLSPVAHLLPLPDPSSTFTFHPTPQSAEEAAVNGNSTSITYRGLPTTTTTTTTTPSNPTPPPRYPLVLLLDSILDPGNLGSIIRSAFFLGVDALAVSTRNTAPLSNVTLKASAGAAEFLPLLSVAHPSAFLEESIANGWKIFAGVPLTPPPPSTPGVTRDKAKPHISPAKHLTHHAVPALEPLSQAPTILLLGGEGDGLRWHLRKKAHYEVAIPSPRGALVGDADLDVDDADPDSGVESLNVGVAAALLCEAFLRPLPQGVERERRGKGEMSGEDVEGGGDEEAEDEARVEKMF
ncbi:MAG: hypothetical protein M1817_002323 [Caeruleum heppii]|nr:MAG: hypothetical protein M1817_003492 [Caeruleum heppii]KAI9673685.1 MAG: hypothetical protein M1817_002323 [Caeruleum heppii]